MFDQCLYFNSVALARRVEREWAQVFAPFSLTPPQAFLLRAILNEPGLLSRDYAAALVISKPTATRSLSLLQERGLIQREIAEEDAREHRIFPTEQANAFKDEINAVAAAMTARLKQQLGNANFSSAVKTLRDVRTALA